MPYIVKGLYFITEEIKDLVSLLEQSFILGHVVQRCNAKRKLELEIGQVQTRLQKC